MIAHSCFVNLKSQYAIIGLELSILTFDVNRRHGSQVAMRHVERMIKIGFAPQYHPCRCLTSVVE